MLTHSHFEAVHDISAGGVLALDRMGLIVYVNPLAAAGYFHGQTVAGKPFTAFFENIRPDGAVPGKNPVTNEEFILRGTETTVLISTSVHADALEERTYVFIRNITPLKKKEHLLAYLNTATQALAKARDTRNALTEISRLIVPRFATWFSIDLIRGNQFEELLLAHQDPDMIRWAREYRKVYPADLHSDNGSARVAKTGEPSFVPVITEEMVRASIKDPVQLQAVLRMNLQSVITVAIYNKEKITGVISFISSEPEHYYDDADLRFAQNLANHIGLALENARLNEELEKTQTQLRSALSSGLVGTWAYDIENDLLYPDENLSRMFGMAYPPDGCKQSEMARRIHPDDRSLIDEQRKESIRLGGQYETEYRVFVGGATRWFFARGQTTLNAEGQPSEFTGVIVDITERKEAELALEESGALFRFLADAIPHKLWTSNPDGSASYYNRGWYAYTGLDNFEELKANIWGFIHPEDRYKAEAEWPEGVAAGREMEMKHRFLRHDGEYRWHLTRTMPHKDDQGNILLWVGTSTDIHDQKMVMESLEMSEAHFKALTQLNSLPIWQVNAACRTVFVNEAWRVFTGVETDEIGETDWTDHIHPDDREATVKDFNTLFAQRLTVKLKYRFRHAPTGKYRWMLDNAEPVFNPEFYGYIGTMTDIEEQEQARLTVQELLSKKDEFMSIASHELKTPLTTIKAFNQLQQRATDPEKARQFIQRSSENIYRLEKLINDLLDVTRINAGKMQYNFEEFDFSQMLAETVQAMRLTATDHELILSGDCTARYTGDRFRLEQVINNLLSNAVKYSPDGKMILVSCTIEYDNIIVSVQDFGIGIARENLDRLFDRYYRVDNTAMRFEGLGLGLYISSEILKRHQGSLWIESEQGQGSTFYFRLPLHQTADKAAPVRTKNHYRDEHLTITFNKESRRLEIDWTGFQDLESVKKGCILMWEYLKEHQVDRVLNDNTHVLGNWSDAVEWVGNIWFPMMEKAGLKYFAHIFSPSTFSQLSAQKSIDIMAGIVTTQYFTDIELAKEWIDSRL